MTTAASRTMNKQSLCDDTLITDNVGNIILISKGIAETKMLFEKLNAKSDL
jgi:hypothetical protein